MKLEDIGFYTLSDNRVTQLSTSSPFWRCELLLTARCNFNCTYCRKLTGNDITLGWASYIVSICSDNNLKNIRFSGGEPTLWPNLPDIIAIADWHGIEKIAISTNGSADLDYYKLLIKKGLNDISISFDTCCASKGSKINGISEKEWEKVLNNIEKLSKLTYVTLGVVLTESNIEETENIIELGYKLGVSDVRLIPTSYFANYFASSISTFKIKPSILKKFPILRYRTNNFLSGRDVRGLWITDNPKCPLVLDDMAIWNNYHYPCIIYLREGGNPIGKVSEKMRDERINWYMNHNSHKDPICSKQCLDICRHYNNRVRSLNNDIT